MTRRTICIRQTQTEYSSTKKCVLGWDLKVKREFIHCKYLESVPKAGGCRTAEGSGPHGSEAGRWCAELSSRGGSESTGRSVNMKELGEILQGQVMKRPRR